MIFIIVSGKTTLVLPGMNIPFIFYLFYLDDFPWKLLTCFFILRAIRRNKEHAVQILIGAGADVDITNRKGVMHYSGYFQVSMYIIFTYIHIYTYISNI